MDHNYCPACMREVGEMDGHSHGAPGPTEPAASPEDFGNGYESGSETPKGSH